MSMGRGDSELRLIADFFFLVLFFILLVVWLLAWGALHVAGGFIHILIVIAVIALIIHFVRRRPAA